MRRYFFAGLTAILIILVFFTGFFIKKQRDLNEILLLKRENQELKAQIQLIAADVKTSENREFLPARVFSDYPFNFKNKITFDLGEKDGVKNGAAVTISENILVGRISEVFEKTSAARTIFDPEWRSPVRISEKEINGLLVGGNEPKISLIEKDVDISVGDVVYSAGADLPYGLKIGEVAEIRDDESAVFYEAILKTPFSANELRKVNIVK